LPLFIVQYSVDLADHEAMFHHHHHHHRRLLRIISMLGEIGKGIKMKKENLGKTHSNSSISLPALIPRRPGIEILSLCCFPWLISGGKSTKSEKNKKGQKEIIS
jgi:hypothetical protein